jgi:hypothetical protein
MQIEEILLKANITHDDKARRVLNTAPDKFADITLKEIQKGITIERLETLSVPVYMYGTQITIHGKFTDMPDDLRVAGYKSVFKNGNGSVGIKYVAIDGDKKQLLERISRYRVEGHPHWGILSSSEGYIAQRIFRPDDKQACIDCYNSTPDSLFIGNKEAFKVWYGGYAVVLHIGAIYQDNLWSLITALTGITSQAEFDRLEAESNAKYQRMLADGEAKRKLEAEANRIKLETAKSNFAVPSNWVEFKGKLTEPGTYAHLTDTWSDGIALQVIKVAKRGGRLCSNSKTFKDFNYVDWSPSGYKQTERSINGWRILAEVKTVKPVTTSSVATDDITISHNTSLNGIEVKFKVKPSDTVIGQLKDLGFRWSSKSYLWYNRYTVDLWDKINAEFKCGVC